MESVPIKNPYEKIEYFVFTNKFAVYERKSPHRRILATFNTLQAAIEARDLVARATKTNA